jgi:hypothetical protein
MARSLVLTVLHVSCDRYGSNLAYTDEISRHVNYARVITLPLVFIPRKSLAILASMAVSRLHAMRHGIDWVFERTALVKIMAILCFGRRLSVFWGTSS